MIHHKALYDVPTAAPLLSISKSGLRKLISAGSVPTVRVGGRVLVSADTIDRIAQNGVARG